MGVIFKNNVIYGAGDIEISPVCYSEEEREVGCWIDGKSLYQKTIHTGALAAGDVYKAHNISNLETVVFAGGVFVWSGKQSPFPTSSRNSIPWNATIADIRSDNIVFEIGSNYSGTYAITDSYTTLQYTKTTDTPGSGIWTPSGVPAMHYSTDEQVVGTWIDGSTLYEQTIYVENPTKSSTSGYYYYNAFSTATDIDFATLLNATIYDATDGRWLDLPHERIISSEAIQIQGMVINHSYQFQVFFQTNQSYNITKMIATIRYTKTTS